MKKHKSDARLEEIKRLAEMPDDEIDTSDIPELTREDFLRGRRGVFYRPVKQAITIRLDSDVIAWLRQDGPGYQTKANQLLREQMLKSWSGKKSNKSAPVPATRKGSSTRSR